MDGDVKTRQQLITTDIAWPNGLTLDFAQNKFYWIDAKLKRLESANMDGTGRKLIFSTRHDFPFALTNFEGRVYWTDWKTNAVKRGDKFDDESSVSTLRRGLLAPMGIKVLHPLRQPKGKF